MSLPLPPKLPPMPPRPPQFIPPAPLGWTPSHDKWTTSKLGYDQAYIHIDATLTRAEVFRLVGELERLGASL